MDASNESHFDEKDSCFEFLDLTMPRRRNQAVVFARYRRRNLSSKATAGISICDAAYRPAPS